MKVLYIGQWYTNEKGEFEFAYTGADTEYYPEDFMPDGSEYLENLEGIEE